jgi:hypothetical protein
MKLKKNHCKRSVTIKKNKKNNLKIKEPKHIYAWKAKLADAGGNIIRIAASTKKENWPK